VLDAAVYYGSGWQGQSRHNAIQVPAVTAGNHDRRLENETLREAIEHWRLASSRGSSL